MTARENRLQRLSLNNGQKTSDAHFIRVSEVSLCLLALLWLYFSDVVLFSE